MNNYIRESTYSIAIDSGADEHAANSCADNAVTEFKAGKKYGQGKPLDLIIHHAKMAAGLTGKQRVRNNKAKPKRASRKKKDTKDMF